MPGAKDITGDLGKLGKRKVFSGAPPGLPGSRPPTAVAYERKLAFDAISFFCWTVIVLFLILQGAFLVWLAR